MKHTKDMNFQEQVKVEHLKAAIGLGHCTGQLCICATKRMLMGKCAVPFDRIRNCLPVFALWHGHNCVQMFTIQWQIQLCANVRNPGWNDGHWRGLCLSGYYWLNWKGKMSLMSKAIRCCVLFAQNWNWLQKEASKYSMNTVHATANQKVQSNI